MAEQSQFIRNLSNFQGIDLSSTELNRPSQFLEDGLNTIQSVDNRYRKRNGTQNISAQIDDTANSWLNVDGYGLFSVDLTDSFGKRQREIVKMTSLGLFRLIERDFTITNSGQAAGINVNLGPDGVGKINCTINIVGGADLVDEDLGTGREASFTTITDLEDIIDAASGISAAGAATTFLTTDVIFAFDVIDIGGQISSGQPFRFDTTDTLPGGLSTSTTFFINRVYGTNPISPDNIKQWDISTDLIGDNGITLTSTGAGTHRALPFHPAAFLEFTENVVVALAGTTSIKYYIWEKIAYGPQTPGVAHLYGAANLKVDDVPNATMGVVNNVAYFSNVISDSSQLDILGSTHRAITKYDGHNFYRAGMADGLTGTFSTTAAGTITDVAGTRTVTAPLTGDFRYKVTFLKIDAAGQVVEGMPSGFGGLTLAGEAGVIAYKATILPGWPTDAVAKVAGAQLSTLTLDVNTAHLLRAGDIAYFWDENQTRFIQREITETDHDTITISSDSLDKIQASPNLDNGGPVDVNSNAVISANYRVAIFRTIAGGTVDYFLVAEVPLKNSAIVTESSFIDEVADSDLGAQLIEPSPRTSPPVVGTVVASFNNSLIVSNAFDDPSTVSFSKTGQPDIFVTATNSFGVDEKVTAASENGDFLIIFNKFRTKIVSGDLGALNFRVESVSNSIGCIAPGSLIRVQESVLYFLSERGPYSLSSGRGLEPLGRSPHSNTGRLEEYFTRTFSDHTEFQAATATLVTQNRSIYLLHVPFLDPTQASTDADVGKPLDAVTSHRTWVYDVNKDSWYPEWDSILANGGMATLDDRFYFNTRTFTKSYLNIETVTPATFKYWDHELAYTFRIESAWEHMGIPSVLKKYVRVNVFNLDSSETNKIRVFAHADFDQTTVVSDETVTLSSQISFKHKLAFTRARAMQIVFENSTGGEATTIAGWTLEFKTAYGPTIKE